MMRGQYTGSRREPRRPAVNNLMSSMSGLNNQEVALAMGKAPNTIAIRNSVGPNNARSWTRGGLNSAGPYELPYVNTLPTLGLIKKRGRGQTLGPDVGDFGPVPLPPRPSHKASGGGFDTVIDESSNNPFGRESNTEKLLLAREKEREFKEQTKGALENLRVFEKGIATR